MRESPPALLAPIDVGLGGVLLANMLVGWLDADPKLLPTGEAADESQDYRTPPQQTSLGVCSSVDASTSPPPSTEHGTPVCPARESAGTGLERADDPHSRPGSGDVGGTDNGAGRLQDPGSGGLDGSGGCGVCLGGLAAGAFQCRLASPAAVVRTHRNAGDRRGRLLRSIRFQRRPPSWIEGRYGASRTSFFARAPPGGQAQQSQER